MGCFRSECFAGVQHKSTNAIYSLRVCDLKIPIAFAGGMNWALCELSEIEIGMIINLTKHQLLSCVLSKKSQANWEKI